MTPSIAKRTLLLATCLSLFLAGHPQGVGIGTTSPNASAQLDVSSTNKGMLMPRVTTAQRKAIVNPAFGLLVFDTDKGSFYLFDGQNWKAILIGNDSDIPSLLRAPTNAPTGSTHGDFSYFGGAVAIAGNYAIGTYPFASGAKINSGNVGAGEAYVFSKAAGWTQTQLLQAPDRAASPNDCFGFSIAMVGNLAVIGAPGATIGSNSNQGAVYVFSFNGTSWTQVQKLQVTGNSNDCFGYAVSTDGRTIAVGAPNAHSGGIAKGVVYTFTPNPIIGAGGAWIMGTPLTYSGGQAGDSLGSSVYVSNGLLVAGAPGANNQAGYAAVYNQSGTSYLFDQLIQAPSPIPSAQFGYSVYSNGSSSIYIGSPGATTSGLIYSFALRTNWAYIPIGVEPRYSPYTGAVTFMVPNLPNGDFWWGYYDATGNSVFESDNTGYFIKVPATPNLHPFAADGTTLVYITNSGFNFKDLQ